MNQPDHIEPTPSPETEGEVEKPPRKEKGRFKIYLLGLLVVLIGGGLGALLGYQAGVSLRKQAEQDQKVMVATQQYQMGLLDMEAGRYDIAKQRFEFVINTDPDFPGAADQLAKAMLQVSLALTPTPVPSPTIAPTPDLRGEEEMFANIQTAMANQDWVGAIAHIEALRTLNLDYRAVDVDGMYYISLRFLGVQKILNEGELEVGIYNLTLAERFAPLDVEAKNYRDWARQYIAAASFWKIDWPRVIDYFAQIYPALPNLHDSSGLTATERYRQALVGYGDQLLMESKYCEAQAQFEAALAFSNLADVQSKATTAAEMCANASATEEPPQPTPSPTVTSGGTPGGIPTDGATVEPVETPRP